MLEEISSTRSSADAGRNGSGSRRWPPWRARRRPSSRWRRTARAGRRPGDGTGRSGRCCPALGTRLRTGSSRRRPPRPVAPGGKFTSSLSNTRSRKSRSWAPSMANTSSAALVGLLYQADAAAEVPLVGGQGPAGMLNHSRHSSSSWYLANAGSRWARATQWNARSQANHGYSHLSGIDMTSNASKPVQWAPRHCGTPAGSAGSGRPPASGPRRRRRAACSRASSLQRLAHHRRLVGRPPRRGQLANGVGLLPALGHDPAEVGAERRRLRRLGSRPAAGAAAARPPPPARPGAGTRVRPWSRAAPG